jgi:integrase
MAIYRREGSSHWWIDITPPTGRRVRESTGTTDKRKAQEYHDRLKSQLWEQQRLGTRPRYTWRETVVRFVSEAEIDGKASVKNDRDALRWLDPWLGDKYLDEIGKDLIQAITKERMKPYVRIYESGQKRECKPGVDTVNRFLTTLRAVLTKARDEWEWIDRIPKVKALKGAVSRIRWITREEADSLIAELPAHLAAMAQFSLETGLRRANVTHLEWWQVDLARKTAWIPAGKAKSGKALAVPLTDTAAAVLEAQLGKHPTWVFPKAGRPVHQTSTKAYRAAVERAGLVDFCWHDLRHTWASWHVQRGTPLNVLQELGGWASVAMVQRYAHLSAEHLRAWVEKPALALVVNNARHTGTRG